MKVPPAIIQSSFALAVLSGCATTTPPAASIDPIFTPCDERGQPVPVVRVQPPPTIVVEPVKPPTVITVEPIQPPAVVVEPVKPPVPPVKVDPCGDCENYIYLGEFEGDELPAGVSAKEVFMGTLVEKCGPGEMTEVGKTYRARPIRPTHQGPKVMQ